jgi:hypothetical protein
MASISFSIKRGVDGFKISDFTTGTLATNADDIELRFNTTDALGAVLTRKDVVKAIEAFERVLESGPIFTTTPVL